MNVFTVYKCGECEETYTYRNEAEKCCTEPNATEQALGAVKVLARHGQSLIARNKRGEFDLIENGKIKYSWISEQSAIDAVKLLLSAD